MSEIIGMLKAKGKSFGAYVRAYERFNAGNDILVRMAKGDLPWVGEDQKNSLVGYYEWLIRKMAATLKPGKFKYLILDTIEPIEAAFTAAVEAGKAQFGWSGQRAYGRMETEGVRPLYEGFLEAIHKTGIEYILIASHIKPVWIDKKPVPGKVKPGGRMAVLARLSTAMFWLVHNPENQSGAPAALVLKSRPGRMDIADDGMWSPRRILPERMPLFSWREIEKYRKDPPNFNNPKPGETMSQNERNMVSQFLNDAQMRYMVMGADAERARAGGGVVARPEPVEVVPEMMSNEAKVGRLVAAGKTVGEIAQELRLPVPLVAALAGK